MAPVQHKYEFKLIRAKEIYFNRLYQRELDNSLITQIFNNFDYHEVNPVKVSYREGSYYAFDGQHTVTALQRKFGDNYLVPCMVYYDIDVWTEEAILFEKINSKKERRPVKTYDLWKSKNNRGDEMVTTIRKIVERHGFILGNMEGNGRSCKIQALEALETVFKEYGENRLEEVLEIIQKAWHGNPKSVKSTMIRGMAYFIWTYENGYKRNWLIEELCKNDPDAVIEGARKLKDQKIKTKNDIAFKIAQIYNGRRNLPKLSALGLDKILK